MSDGGRNYPLKASFRERRRARRLEKRRDDLYWKLADAKADHRNWAFGRSPSENHRNEQRIERLAAKLAAMEATNV